MSAWSSETPGAPRSASARCIESGLGTCVYLPRRSDSHPGRHAVVSKRAHWKRSHRRRIPDILPECQAESFLRLSHELLEDDSGHFALNRSALRGWTVGYWWGKDEAEIAEGLPCFTLMFDISQQNHHLRDVVPSLFIGAVIGFWGYRARYRSAFLYRSNHFPLPYHSFTGKLHQTKLAEQWEGQRALAVRWPLHRDTERFAWMLQREFRGRIHDATSGRRRMGVWTHRT